MDPSDPKRPAAPPTAEELAACRRVLEALAVDLTPLTLLDQDERRALLTAAGQISRPDRKQARELQKAFRRRDREAQKAADLEALGQSGLRLQRQSPVYKPLWLEPPREEPEEREGPELQQERACYVCKAPFRTVHFFYDSMCQACGDFNYAKRSQSAPLHGRVALVTGARVKIGYQASLKLLRAGAKVIATTRFAHDAAQRYAQEPDFAEWSGRLQIHGLDLRHSPSVELLARFLCEREERLDFIVNNACQTVRRPPGFYEHLLDLESQPIDALPAPLRPVVQAHAELAGRLQSSHKGLPAGGSVALVPGAGDAPGVGLWKAAHLSQLRYLDEDYRSTDALFPKDRFDEDLQQVDLRETNSWRLTMAQVPTAELLEVQLVNAVAPFILNAQLKPLMLRHPSGDKHIVNVSAMEGQFYRAKKTDRHPHTNMAKAALNMMTRTSAPDYAKDGIWMNAVDTGWVTDEDPAALAARKAELGFQPPLDIIDGAARIVDPIFAGQLTGEHPYGQFLKDYKPAPW